MARMAGQYPPTQESQVWTKHELMHDPHFAPDKAERVRQMFTAIASRYDLNNRLHSFGRDQAWRRRTAALARVGPNEHALDAACGTGDLAFLLARAGAQRVVAADFTDAMLDVARQKARQAAKRGILDVQRVEFAHADVMQLPFDDASFDIVTIAFGLRNVAQPGAALREFRRVLRRENGRLLVLEFSQPGNRLIRGLNRLYTGHIMPLTASIVARDRSGAYRYLPRSVQTFVEGDALRQGLRDAGFTTTEQYSLTFGVCAITIGRMGEASGDLASP